MRTHSLNFCWALCLIFEPLTVVSVILNLIVRSMIKFLGGGPLFILHVTMHLLSAVFCDSLVVIPAHRAPQSMYEWSLFAVARFILYVHHYPVLLSSLMYAVIFL